MWNITNAIGFNLENFEEIRNLLYKNDIKIIIDDCIPTYQLPKEITELIGKLKKKINDLEDQGTKEGEEIDKLRKIIDWYSSLEDILILGEYRSEKKEIILYPNNMKILDASKFEELLQTTFVHEVMHAYFDRDDTRKKLPYILQIEEPLAEFGMLLFFKRNNEKFNLYEWALNFVRSKNNFYGLGADIMDAYSNNPNRTHRESYQIPDEIQNLIKKNSDEIQEYLETYKMNIDPNLTFPFIII